MRTQKSTVAKIIFLMTKLAVYTYTTRFYPMFPKLPENDSHR